MSILPFFHPSNHHKPGVLALALLMSASLFPACCGRHREEPPVADPALDAPGYVERARELIARGDFEGASRNCSRAITLDGKSAEAYAVRATARRRQGDIDGAIQDAAAALLLDPTLPDPHADRGLARLERNNDADGAAGDFEDALKLAPAGWPRRAEIEAALRKLRTP